MEAIMKLQNISKRFPGVIALEDVSVEFRQGEVHALVGENGAGKSTLIKTLTGVHKPDQGSIIYNGVEYTGFTPRGAKELGIGVIYQELSLVNHLTVAENIFLSDLPRKGFLLDRQTMVQKTEDVLRKMDIHIDPNDTVKKLSIGFQQMVELAKAIVEQSKVLIMDEPTAPLSNHEVEILFQLVTQLRQAGITIIYISHRIDEIFRLADRVSVLRDGKLVKTMDIGETDKDHLISLMVGRDLKDIYPKRNAPAGGDIILQTKRLTGNGVRDISLKIRRGEILGLGGLVGSGRTEFAELLYGAKKVESGEVIFNGEKIVVSSPKHAMKNRIMMVPEDRKRQGLILDQSVKNNISITVLKNISELGVLNKTKEVELARKYVEKMRIKISGLEQRAKNLSGGNQHTLVLSKGMAITPDLIIIDE
ncbi:MAG: sugar ABC transporter ATP-binding protein, partial [Planctomycetaceae bacterium]|nr:sugar ABC transporter ATP-binding protein [Planctomycetaceae bacterium]